VFNKSLGWRAGVWAYAPLLLWIGVIFYLSSDQGSMSQTSRFLRPLLELLFPAAPEETLQLYHSYIRKFAHFTVYAILGFLALRAFAMSSSQVLQRSRYLLSLGVVVLIATIDEVNQGFSAARTGSGWDVLLDISGGIVMITALWLLGRPSIQTSDSGNFV
jgi:VanZ family protein